MTKEEKDKIEEQIINQIDSPSVHYDKIIDVLKTIKTPYFYYDSRNIINKFPKAIKSLKKFMIDHSEGQLDGLEDQDLVMSLFVNPRMLYDFFDSKGIYISIGKESTENGDTIFYGYIEIDNQEEVYQTDKLRHTIEEKIFSEAFNILNGTTEG